MMDESGSCAAVKEKSEVISCICIERAEEIKATCFAVQNAKEEVLPKKYNHLFLCGPDIYKQTPMMATTKR